MRENVIEQLEEEIQAKQRLIYEQDHLIHILEHENRCEEVKVVQDSLTSDSEITVIERFMTSTSPCHSNSNCNDQCDRLRERLEQALVEREKLELQNEQLLKQWEEALEYVTTVRNIVETEPFSNHFCSFLFWFLLSYSLYSSLCILTTTFILLWYT
ncbi:unnamed protein product [Angiostrongylus costaricensis]|uniref:ERC protein 2 n=1 Tax=Angiostrongylus costaricensis TaxID=334426 RepID=A0A0R3PBI4_ANGCS|nr:unnamed protein product [Angiostrongylus costaricensis]